MVLTDRCPIHQVSNRYWFTTPNTGQISLHILFICICALSTKDSQITETIIAQWKNGEHVFY